MDDIRHLWVNIEEIPEEGVEINEKRPSFFADIGPYREVKLNNPVNIRCFLKKIYDRVYSRGIVNTLIDIECSRCLEWFKTDIKVEYNSTYFPESINNTFKKNAEIKIKEEDVDIYYYYGEKIDLLPQARDQILLSIPMKPLCRDDCPGLCAGCGKKINNIERCGCSREYIDPRLDVLKKIKEKLTS